MTVWFILGAWACTRKLAGSKQPVEGVKTSQELSFLKEHFHRWHLYHFWHSKQCLCCFSWARDLQEKLPPEVAGWWVIWTTAWDLGPEHFLSLDERVTFSFFINVLVEVLWARQAGRFTCLCDLTLVALSSCFNDSSSCVNGISCSQMTFKILYYQKWDCNDKNNEILVKYWHAEQPGWTLKALYYVKDGRHKRPLHVHVHLNVQNRQIERGSK